jgi:type IV secretory pathway TrbD component
MAKNLVNLANLILGLTFVVLVIVYASIVIPIVLASIAGFCLVLWLLAHAVDGIYSVSRWIKKKVLLHS